MFTTYHHHQHHRPASHGTPLLVRRHSITTYARKHVSTRGKHVADRICNQDVLINCHRFQVQLWVVRLLHDPDWPGIDKWVWAEHRVSHSLETGFSLICAQLWTTHYRCWLLLSAVMTVTISFFFARVSISRQCCCCYGGCCGVVDETWSNSRQWCAQLGLPTILKKNEAPHSSSGGFLGKIKISWEKLTNF